MSDWDSDETSKRNNNGNVSGEAKLKVSKLDSLDDLNEQD